MLPVLLLHGARVSGTMWRPQLEALRRAGRPAVAIDLPGHGVHLGERFSVAAGLEAIACAIDDLGGRALVCGMSLGGYLGIHHAARRPDQVAGLVAAGCSSVPDQPATTAWLLAVRGFFMRLPDQGAWLNQRLVDAALPADGAAAAGAGGYALGVMSDLLTELRQVDPRADLARTRCPVWLVNGQLDHFRLQERAFAAAAPDARVVTIRGATHLANLVRPVAFTRVLLEALDEVDGREVDRREVDRREAAGVAQRPTSGVLPVREGPRTDTAHDPR